MDTLNVEQQCAILQTVAKQYPATASEYQSVELGAKALLFIFMNGHMKEFTEQLKEYDQQDDRSEAEILREARKDLPPRPSK
jgi:hypothetical protein